MKWYPTTLNFLSNFTTILLANTDSSEVTNTLTEEFIIENEIIITNKFLVNLILKSLTLHYTLIAHIINVCDPVLTDKQTHINTIHSNPQSHTCESEL